MIVYCYPLMKILVPVRPEFTDTLALKNARHPVLDRMKGNVVPNNVYASDDRNFCVLTGPNMSGKSTYLKTIAVLQVGLSDCL